MECAKEIHKQMLKWCDLYKEVQLYLFKRSKESPTPSSELPSSKHSKHIKIFVCIIFTSPDQMLTLSRNTGVTQQQCELKQNFVRLSVRTLRGMIQYEFTKLSKYIC